MLQTISWHSVTSGVYRPAPLTVPLSASNNGYRLPVSQRVALTARQFFNASSRLGPDGGNLACAYMVNLVLKHATGRTYGIDPTTVNSVREDLLRSGGHRVPVELAREGDIAMVFNEAALQGVGGATAHIGIVIGPNMIVANSSSTKRFNALFDFQAFSELYQPYFEIIRLPEIAKYDAVV